MGANLASNRQAQQNDGLFSTPELEPTAMLG